MDRIMEAASAPVIAAYEERLTKLEDEKLLAKDRMAGLMVNITARSRAASAPCLNRR